MVNVGFICEGITEKTILDSANFREILKKNAINVVGDVIDAEGNGNLLPENIEDDQNKLFKVGADFILILTDLDNDACITRTKERIGSHEKQLIIVSVKQVEAWFLADSVTIGKLLGEDFNFELPESELLPFDAHKCRPECQETEFAEPLLW